MVDTETDIEQEKPCTFEGLTNQTIHAQKKCFQIW